MPKNKRFKDSLGRNRSMEEIAEELGLSTGPPRDKSQRESTEVRNAGQGQVPVRGEKKK